MTKEFRTLADPDTVRETIADLDLGGGVEQVDLRDARGRVLAERVDAAIDVPGFDRAAMDGYAVQASDTVGAGEVDPAVLDLAGTVHAGETPEVTVAPGTCVEISTGAVMPPGADAVVVVERTDEINDDGDADNDDTAIEIRTAVAPSENVMLAGADIAAGTRALGPGTRLTPREIGLLSALGVDEVPVRTRPRVGIISTGDELVPPGDPLDSERGEIYDVNTTTIAAGVDAAGGEPVVYPHAGDDFEAMETLLRQAADECDLVLSSGSTSASAVDVIYRVIEERGELLLHGVAVKPGKPLLVGRIDQHDDATEPSATGETAQSAYIGLPGYPVSALTIFRVFVAPAIRAAAGQPEPTTATVDGELIAQQRHDEGRLRLLSVALIEDADGEPLVYPVDKGSGATTSLVDADGVVAIDPDTDYLAAGESVTVQLFDPDVRPPSLLAVGEADPALTELLDQLDRPRFLPVGSREGLRRLRDGIPDLAVVAGPTDREVDAVDVGELSREWGLLVPKGNPDGVDGLADLIDDDIDFVNRNRDSGLRASFDAELDALAASRGVDRRDLTAAINGYEATVSGVESPARRVADDRAAVGLGLRATADRHDLGFVSLGTQSVRLLGNPDRDEKPAVDAVQDALDTLPAACSSLAGYQFE
ncbi:molybdopterin biosynthesis protein [Halonotius sp. GCM10025705]|uniref:molybdopterin biosynthesis protein n=1 Tax=Halonotius sp. GCM10025705 TaxID=3252678 RepID=UPI00360E8318